MSLTLAGTGFFVSRIAGCNSDIPTSATGDARPEQVSNRCLDEAPLATISANHGHMLTVSPGDVLFLPRKLTHSVQCTVDGGFDVVGVIYPGNNPAINY